MWITRAAQRYANSVLVTSCVLFVSVSVADFISFLEHSAGGAYYIIKAE